MDQDLPKPQAEVPSKDKGQLAALSYGAHARAAFPEAKRRFLKGLQEGAEPRVTARLKDSGGRAINNLIIVDRIENGWITGHWCECMARGVSEDAKDIYTFSEEDVMDWVIQRSNGVTEGDFGPWPLGSQFASDQWGTGTTCDQAERAASSPNSGSTRLFNRKVNSATDRAPSTLVAVRVAVI